MTPVKRLISEYIDVISAEDADLATSINTMINITTISDDSIIRSIDYAASQLTESKQLQRYLIRLLNDARGMIETAGIIAALPIYDNADALPEESLDVDDLLPDASTAIPAADSTAAEVVVPLGQLSLRAAIDSKQVDVAIRLIEEGAHPDGGNAAVRALRTTNDVLKEGFERSAYMQFFRRFKPRNTSDSSTSKNYTYDDTPLLVAIRRRLPTVVQSLLTHGANVNLGNNDGKLPIKTAFRVYSIEIIDMLLRAGADISKADLQSRFFTAYDRGKHQLIMYPLFLPTNPLNFYDELLLAITQNNSSRVASVLEKNPSYRTSLWFDFAAGTSTVRIFRNDNFPIYWAAQLGFTNILGLLMDRLVDSESYYDLIGLLTHAYNNKQFSTVDYLVEKRGILLFRNAEFMDYFNNSILPKYPAFAESSPIDAYIPKRLGEYGKLWLDFTKANLLAIQAEMPPVAADNQADEIKQDKKVVVFIEMSAIRRTGISYGDRAMAPEMKGFLERLHNSGHKIMIVPRKGWEARWMMNMIDFFQLNGINFIKEENFTAIGRPNEDERYLMEKAITSYADEYISANNKSHPTLGKQDVILICGNNETSAVTKGTKLNGIYYDAGYPCYQIDIKDNAGESSHNKDQCQGASDAILAFDKKCNDTHTALQSLAAQLTGFVNSQGIVDSSIRKGAAQKLFSIVGDLVCTQTEKMEAAKALLETITNNTVLDSKHIGVLTQRGTDLANIALALKREPLKENFAHLLSKRTAFMRKI